MRKSDIRVDVVCTACGKSRSLSYNQCERIKREQCPNICQPCNAIRRRKFEAQRTKVFKTCRHCERGCPSRPKGLCWKCYNTPGVRDLYTPVSPCGSRADVPDFCGAAPLPTPTTATPGSPEKLAVLMARAAARQQLFHPEDPHVEIDELGTTTLYGVFRGKSISIPKAGAA